MLQKAGKHDLVRSKFPDSDSFTNEMNHRACLERYKGYDTVEKATKSSLIKISELKEIYSERTPELFIRSWLLQLNLFVNVENKLSEHQIIELASYMYDEIYMLNLAELTLLFKRIKNGHYAPFYNRIDATQILIICREFRRERAKYFIEIQDKEKEAKDYENLKKKVESELKKEKKS